MVNTLYKADYQFLSDEVDAVQNLLLDKPVNLTELKKDALTVSNQSKSSIYRYYVRVLDNKQNSIIETLGMNEVLDVKQYMPHSTDRYGKKSYWWYNHNDTNYLLLQSPVKMADGSYGTAQVVLDISHQHSIISDRKKLIAALLAGMLLAILFGFSIARKGTKILSDLTDTAEKITVASLHQRIDPKSWPKELRRLGTAFNQMLERIEESFLRLTQFSADLAHELRTPINNLISVTEVSLSHSTFQLECQQVLESNLEELHRISQMIENLLFLARAENPQLSINKTILNVHDEVALVSEFYQASAEEKDIKIITAGCAVLNANSVMFRRMISNLLSNAIKYTNNGGLIHINTLELNLNTIVITVSDNGIGIAQEHLAKIFNRFYRVDAARSTTTGGIGLGLAIVKSIATLHNGIVAIASTPDVGTTVTITLQK